MTDVLATSVEFGKRLETLKSEERAAAISAKGKGGFGPDDTWYRYGSIGNIDHLASLLTGGNRSIFTRLEGRPLADIGGADGDVGFFFSDLGFEVDLIDNPPTNWNQMRGMHALKRRLGSEVSIHERDLHEQFELPRATYGAIFFLGILYHLQNPFSAMKKLAECTQYCFVSSKIARFAGAVDISSIPVAYLLGPTECNNDVTNYWVFSAAGLERLLERTGWRVLDWQVFGDTENSEVASTERDERAFALLESTVWRGSAPSS